MGGRGFHLSFWGFMSVSSDTAHSLKPGLGYDRGFSFKGGVFFGDFFFV